MVLKEVEKWSWKGVRFTSLLSLWCFAIYFQAMVLKGICCLSCWIHLITDAIHWLGPVNSVKYLLDKIGTFMMVLKGVIPMEFWSITLMEIWGMTLMELRMVLKGIYLNAVGISGGLICFWILTWIVCPYLLDLLRSSCHRKVSYYPTGPSALPHIMNWNEFLFPHLWHFLPHIEHSLGRWDWLHLLHDIPGPPLALQPLLSLGL